MAGHSRPKDGVASARLCPGHPRLSCLSEVKTWMPGTSPGMTSFAIRHHFVGCISSRTSALASIRDLVAGGLDDRLPERGVGGQFLDETFGRGPDRDQADRQKFFFRLGFGKRRRNGLAQLFGKSRRTARRETHPVP